MAHKLYVASLSINLTISYLYVTATISYRDGITFIPNMLPINLELFAL